MADSIILPGARARLVNADGTCAAEFYRFFQRVAPTKALSDVADQVTNITNILNGSGAFLPATTRLEAVDGLTSTGLLSTGFMSISLEDVEQEPGGTLQTITIDGKGRVVESSPADTDDLPEGSTNLYFTDARAQAAVHLVFNRIDAAGDIRVDADGNLRVTN
jgi:hypothetical protein